MFRHSATAFARTAGVHRGSTVLSSAAFARGVNVRTSAGIVRLPSAAASSPAPSFGFAACVQQSAALGASATMSMRGFATTTTCLSSMDTTAGEVANAGAGPSATGGAAVDGAVPAAAADEELLRARLRGAPTAETGSSGCAITHHAIAVVDEDAAAATGDAGSGAAPAQNSTDGARGATASSPTADGKGVQFQTNFRPLSKVDGISEEDRELIRKALSNEPNAPAREVGEGGGGGVKQRMGGVGHGVAGGDMAAVFTCDVCGTRTIKRFTKHAYTKGVVMVQCPGCGNKHLLADNLGWFEDEHKTIEDILRAKGQEVRRLQGSVFLDEGVL